MNRFAVRPLIGNTKIKSVLNSWSLNRWISQSYKNYKNQKSLDIKSCWNCHAAVPVSCIRCPENTCHKIQPPPKFTTNSTVELPASFDINYFKLIFAHENQMRLQIPHFNIDLKRLKLNYVKLQQMCHPDQLVSQDIQGEVGEKEKMWAEQQSATLNRAYQTLKDPLNRSIYLVRNLNFLNRFI